MLCVRLLKVVFIVFVSFQRPNGHILTENLHLYFIGLKINRIGCQIYSFVSFLGTLHVGDELREINSEPVFGKSIEYLQRQLVCYNLNCVLLLNDTKYRSLHEPPWV